MENLKEDGAIRFLINRGYFEARVEVTLDRIMGYRPWFLCPGCYRRVLCLYLPHELMADPLCRHCYRINYPCRTRHKDQQWENVDKWEHKLRKIQEKLGNPYLRKRKKRILRKEADHIEQKLLET